MKEKQSIQAIHESISQLYEVESISINNIIDKYNFNAVVERATIDGCSGIVHRGKKQMLIQKSGPV